MLSKSFGKTATVAGVTDVSSLPISRNGEGCVSSEMRSASGEICFRWQESRTE